MLRVPLVASTGRPGYWLELLVAEGAQQRQGCPAFGVGDGFGLVGVSLG